MKREPFRVLIGDDSPTVRALFRRLLSSYSWITVVGEAADASEVVGKVLELRPDVVIMDLQSPHTGGLAAMQRIQAQVPTPIIVVTSRVERGEVRAPFEAVDRGAITVLAKPEIPREWEELVSSIADTVGGLRSPVRARKSTPASPGLGKVPRRRLKYLAIGASTGGPSAVRDLLAALGSDHNLGIVVIQHIGRGFERSFAEWLSRELHTDVKMAVEGKSLAAGEVLLAPSNTRMSLSSEGIIRLENSGPKDAPYPLVIDHFLLSLARLIPSATAGVLLSGMGHDGARGLTALHRSGGTTIVQDQPSSVVYGMPGAAIEAGAAEFILPPPDIGRLLRRMTKGQRQWA